MNKFDSWLEAAAEESMKMAIRSSMDIVSSMRKDMDNKEDVDHDKLDMLYHCWDIIDKISHVVAVPEKKDVDGRITGHLNGSVPGNYKTV